MIPITALPSSDIWPNIRVIEVKESLYVLEEVGMAESFFMWATMAFNEDGSTLRRGNHAEYDEWALNTTSIRLFQLGMTFFVASVLQIPCSVISNSFTSARVKIRADMLFFMHAPTFIPSFVNPISI